jgi:hypothetical protein
MIELGFYVLLFALAAVAIESTMMAIMRNFDD